MSLGERALSGAFWMSLYRWLHRGSGIISAIILARLLTPEDFGLIALAMMVIGLMDGLVTPGIGSAVIQQKEIEDEDLDIAWTFDRLIPNFIISALIFFSAPYVSSYFGEIELELVIKWLSAIPILRSLENPVLIALSRNLDYKKNFYLYATPSIVRLLLVIPLAFILQNVWALVIAAISEPISRAIVSYIIQPKLPVPNLNINKVKHFFGFGKWMWAFQIVKIVKENLHSFVIGKLLGATSLGYFQVGRRFSGEITGEFYNVISKVLFPIYAKVQDDSIELKKKYLAVFQLVIFIASPLCIGMYLVAKPAVIFILGTKWVDAVPVIQLLAIAGLVDILIGTAYPLFRGSGKPKFEFLLYISQVVLLLPSLIILTNNFGVTGAALAILITNVCLLPIWLFLLIRNVKVGLREILRVSILPIIGSLIMTASVASVLMLIGEDYSPLIQLIAPILSGGFTYLLWIYFAIVLFKVDSLIMIMNRFSGFWIFKKLKNQL